MPCDTIQTSDIDLGKVDPGLLFQALQTMGLNPQKTSTGIDFKGGEYEAASGTLSLRYSAMTRGSVPVEQRTAEIKRAYSGEAIKSQAKRYGWQVKATGENKYQIVKRSF